MICVPLFLVFISRTGSLQAYLLNKMYTSYQNSQLWWQRSNKEKDAEERYLFGSGDSIDDSTDELQMHPAVALAIALSYMLFGAVMYKLWEPWTFLESFYFIFISVSTIGFGDYVPTEQDYFLLSSLYLIGGLSLFAMFFEMMKKYYGSYFSSLTRKFN